MPRKSTTTGTHTKRSSATRAGDLFEDEPQVKHDIARRRSRDADNVLNEEVPTSRNSQARSRKNTIARAGISRTRGIDEANEDDDVESVVHEVSAKREAMHRARARKRANNLFDKQYADSAATDASGPRAALYARKEGRGARHARKVADATREQSAQGVKHAGARMQVGIGDTLKGALQDDVVRKIVFGVGIAFVVLIMVLYMPAKQHYAQYRDNARKAEIIALYEENNQAMQEKIQAVSTKEGIEEIARRELGWVDAGEQLVVVEGRETEVVETEEEKQEILRQVIESQIAAPTTWYSPLFDIVFMYDNRTPAQKQKEDHPRREVFNE